MPRIAIFDATSVVYRIDTFDLHKVRVWLDEWVPRLKPPQNISGYPPLRIEVQPLFSWNEGRIGEPDWPADTRYFAWFEVPWEPGAIMDAIESRREFIESDRKERADG